MTSGAVLRICDHLSRGLSLRSACIVEGVRPSRPAWERSAEAGDDPFYGWMLTCIEIASASFVGDVESTMAQIALDPKNKDAAKVGLAILARRSEDYKDDSKGGPQTGTGGVTVTINMLNGMLQGTSPARMVDLAYPADVIDADEGEETPALTQDPETHAIAPTPAQGKAFAFKRTPPKADAKGK